MLKGKLRTKLVQENHSQYSLLGMINPTFQNQGTANVFIDGWKVSPNQSFIVNSPNIELQNSISIYFEEDATKSKNLFIGFTTAITN